MPRGSFYRCAGLSGGDFFNALPGGVGILSEEGSFECLFISPSGWVCSAGLLFQRGKSRQKRAGETPDPPLYYLIGRYQRRYPVATELLQGRWPLVIGAEGVRLRLTALGLMVVSCFSDESLSISRIRR